MSEMSHKMRKNVNKLSLVTEKEAGEWVSILVRVLELTLEELDPNQPLTDEKKAFWIVYTA